MATVTTNDLRVRNAKRFATTATGSYAFIGKPTVWSEVSDAPTNPVNNVDSYNDIHNQMLSLKRIDTSNVHHLIRRINWTSGLTYDMYRHDYSPIQLSSSGASNLYDANFLVINQNNNVYACLDNRGGAVSSVEPLNSTDTPFYTSDGYQWVKIYEIDSSSLINYSTTFYIPVTQKDVIEYTSGSITTVVIDAGGTSYTDRPAGVISSLPYYFCNITGDGSGAVARITVADGVVTEINVVRGGEGYTYGIVEFGANTVYQTLSDLDKEVNPLNPEGNGDFRSTVIIPPSGGWGTDLIREIGATTIGIFTDFGYTESDFINDISYRQIGLIKDVSTIANNPATAAAYNGIKVTDLGGIVDYQTGEIISQTVAVETEEDTFVTARGIVVGWDTEQGVVFYIQDPKFCIAEDGYMHKFGGSGAVVGETSTKITTPEEEYTGQLLGVSFENGYSNPEIVKYTGDLIYISHKAEIQRTETQTEKLNFILTF